MVDIKTNNGMYSFVINGQECPTHISFSRGQEVISDIRQSHGVDFNSQMLMIIRHQLSQCANALCDEKNYQDDIRLELIEKISNLEL